MRPAGPSTTASTIWNKYLASAFIRDVRMRKKKEVGCSRSEKRTLHGETDDVMMEVCSKNPSATIREKNKDVREGRREDLDGCRVEVVKACWR